MSDLPRPRTPAQLLTFLDEALDVRVARRALLEGHDAPLAYLTHAFFEPEQADAPRDAIVWAGRGTGKTFLGAVATLLDLVFKPGVEVRILGGSVEQAQRMHAHLRALFSREAVRDLVEGRITERKIRLVNGSGCEILAPTHASVRGCRVQKLRCDEVELFPRDIWEAAQLTTRSRQCGDVYVRGAVEALSTMHEPGGLMGELVEQARSEGDRRLFRWSAIDALERCPAKRPCAGCPLFPDCAGRAKEGQGHMPIDDAIQLMRRVSRPVWETEMLCLRPRRADLVLPEFDRRTHLLDEAAAPAPKAQWIGGMDFGFRSPTVALLAQLDGQNVVRVFKEKVASRTRLDVFAHWLLEEGPPAWVGVDPAGRQRSIQTGVGAVTALRRAGLCVRDRRVRLVEGLERVRARLAPASGGPTLFVHPSCRELIRSLETYRFDKSRPWSEEPLKDGADHAVDALRYMLVNLDAGGALRRRTYL